MEELKKAGDPAMISAYVCGEVGGREISSNLCYDASLVTTLAGLGQYGFLWTSGLLFSLSLFDCLTFSHH